MSEATEKSNRLSALIRGEALRRDRSVKIALLAVSLLTIALLVAAALRENFLAPWRLYQRQYARILNEKATDDRGRKLARDFRVEMKQAVLPELGTIDRCVSCHTGIDDPRMTDVKNPFVVHPGDYLAWHEVNRFGCTVCHRGQGRAMSFEDAKAEGHHWDYPLVATELSQSSCGLCHSAREVADRGGEIYAAGAALFEAKGCRGCHKLDGRGGSLGPALDNEGLKVQGNLPMANVKGPHTLPQWLMEHFADPQAVVAGSRMPTPGLSRTQTIALTTFLLSLQQRDLPGSYLTAERHLVLYENTKPEPLTGERLFNRYCSTCHDTGVIGRYDKFFATFIPAVRGESFRATADPAYVAANIRQGRAGTIMPAWGAAAGGMSEEEIRKVTSYVLGRDLSQADTAPVPETSGQPMLATARQALPPTSGQPMPATSGQHVAAHASRPTLVSTSRPALAPSGDPDRGAGLFLKHCSGCHGTGGGGKIGPSLNTPVLRASASDAFLEQTIALGRRNTAMPAWRIAGGLSDRDIRDLISHIRSLP